MKELPRVLIEDWLPAAAIGVECIRERSTGQQPPDKRLHVWSARRPLTAARAAVLGSLLPADFPREVFERLLGFGQCLPDWELLRSQRAPSRILEKLIRAIERGERSRQRVLIRQLMDMGIQCGSIPLESTRLGFHTLANEYNPVACSVLEATVDYPFRFGGILAEKARKWGKELHRRFVVHVEHLFPKTVHSGLARPDGYIFARTVPCPDTQHPTPLVPNWFLLKPKSGKRIVAEPVVDQKKGTWTVRIRELGKHAGQLREPPRPTYAGGMGVSLFTGRQIPADYIKAMAQAGQTKSALYAVAIKTQQGMEFQHPEPADLKRPGPHGQ